MLAFATLAAPVFQLSLCSSRRVSPAAQHAGAKRLAARGAVLVTGDAGNQEDLRSTFADAWGVFAMTFVHAVTGTQDAAIEEEFALGALTSACRLRGTTCEQAVTDRHRL